MKSLLRLILVNCFIFVFSSSALATTQYYYLQIEGSGSNSGDKSAWSAVPTTDANAMSASNFNDASNWSTSDSSNKIDPDDIVYVKGSGWTSQSYSLTPVYGVTLDFYENGDFDYETMNHKLEPFFRQCKINITADNVTILDGRFNGEWYGSGRSIDAGASTTGMKISNLIVKRCVFNAVPDYPSVYLGFVCDSEISDNYFAANMTSPCQSKGRPITIHAGSRNKFNNNYINGGYTGIIFAHKRDWNEDGVLDVPAYGSYTADPDFNFEDNEVAYNHIESRCEEGITYDVGSSNKSVTIVERDDVASVSGTTITLNNSGGEWTGVGDLYSGYYMTAITDRDNTYGNHALITSQSGNSFTLESAIDNLTTGDVVVIGFAFRHNWIHHNTFGLKGTADSYILLEGMALENLVEYNELPASPYSSGSGIKVSSLYQYNKANNSITKTYASEPAAYNIIQNNTVDNIISISWGKDYGPGDLFFTRNNAFINNTLHQVYYPRTVDLKWSSAYLHNTGNYKLLIGSTKLSSDPTLHVAEYFANWGIKISYDSALPEAPKGVKVALTVQ